MFSQNQEEVKLEWMYKAPHSTVDREEYLLGRSVDKTFEQISTEEKQQIGITQPKNHVEHECIPPSIREYKQQCGEQVDITTKLQEDPLIAIKKQEEEKRRQFLNNPVQIKKLQKALKAQKKNKHRSTNSDEDLDAKLADKLRLLQNGNLIGKKSKKLKDASLDTILMHKYNQLKGKLSDNDLRDIFEGAVDSSSSSSDSCGSEDEDKVKRLKRNKNSKNADKRKYETHTKKDYKSQKISHGRESGRSKSNKFENRVDHTSTKYRVRHRSHSHERREDNKKTYQYESRAKPKTLKRRSSSESHSSSDSEPPKKKNWGLVKADGTKIPLTVQHTTYAKPQVKTTQAKPNENRNRQHLTEEEKEKRRKEMLVNASWREQERSKNLENHRKNQLKEDEDRKAYKPKFLEKELLKSANSGSVESRIKANINNIQRSGSDMNKHFSRR